MADSTIIINEWRKKSIKKRLANPTSVLFVIFILFYAVQIIFRLYSDRIAPSIDLAVAVMIFIICLVLHLLFKFKIIVPILISIGLFTHIIGLYRIIPINEYHIGSLYGAPQLNYHYDWFVHSFGFGMYVLAACIVFYPYLRKAFRNKPIIFLFILFFMMGLSALNEIAEFAGYTAFGYGEGFLEFGDGDSSPDHGPWQNASMDLVSNLIGGIVFAGLFMLFRKRDEDK
ncbi:MAG: DUF2238 domain-containing protein [Candidatus Woesearchaeota archaeon]